MSASRIAPQPDYTNINERCAATPLRFRQRLAVMRLMDVISAAKLYYGGRKKQATICFLVRHFALASGFSKDTAFDLTKHVNSKFAEPLADDMLDKFTRLAGENYNYSSKKLVSILGIDGMEAELGLHSIISEREKKRLKSQRNAAYYAEKRSGISKAEQIRQRQAELCLLIISGRLDETAFRNRYAISRRTFYADKKQAKTLLYCLYRYILLTYHRRQALCELLRAAFYAGNKNTSSCSRFQTVSLLILCLVFVPPRPPDTECKKFSQQISSPKEKEILNLTVTLYLKLLRCILTVRA